MVERLDAKALERVKGPAWEPLRTAFLDASRQLLAVSPAAISELTTIYVKFSASKTKADVFAVIWLKTSRQLVIGLSLADNVNSPLLGPPPSGMSYNGLTRYLTIMPGETLPAEFSSWARLAFASVSGVRAMKVRVQWDVHHPGHEKPEHCTGAVQGLVGGCALLIQSGRDASYAPANMKGTFLRVIGPVTPEIEEFLNGSGFQWSGSPDAEPA